MSTVGLANGAIDGNQGEAVFQLTLDTLHDCLLLLSNAIDAAWQLTAWIGDGSISEAAAALLFFSFVCCLHALAFLRATDDRLLAFVDEHVLRLAIGCCPTLVLQVFRKTPRRCVGHLDSVCRVWQEQESEADKKIGNHFAVPFVMRLTQAEDTCFERNRKTWRSCLRLCNHSLISVGRSKQKMVASCCSLADHLDT